VINTVNILKYSLIIASIFIDQLAKFFLLIGQSKAFGALSKP